MKWWRGEDFGRPLFNLMSRPPSYQRARHTYDGKTGRLDAASRYEGLKRGYGVSTLYGDTLPFAGISIGVGCMAAFLGGEPIFMEDTTWMKPLADKNVGLSSLGPLEYDPDNFWWKEHLRETAKLADLCRDDGIIVTIPDILENLDVIALLCGSQNMCYYLMDEPDLFRFYLGRIDDLYFEYYDRIYDVIKDRDGSNGSLFNIWSEKRTLKIQCDVAVFLSPRQFDELIMPSFERQLSRIDYSLYHLDGPDAIKYLDSILTLKDLKALQFTPGDGNPAPEKEIWYPIYDKVRKAGKSVWVYLTGDDPIGDSKKLTERYGTAGLYLLYGSREEELAKRISDAAYSRFR
jgi:5-methyltetrahydrofolate--homocysteine methyltransferase